MNQKAKRFIKLLNILACFSSITLSAKPYEKIPDLNSLKIISPALQSQKYSKMRLSNGLEALLISDPNANQSAAALAVEAGSWHDPEKYPGTAHFLEHMLFLGTGKYPVEDEYMQFISNRGGLVNAYTAPDRTVYMFSVANDSFHEALDRFSHFFIDPLFNPSGVHRELHAVDQENDKNIENDVWREWMIFKENGSMNHPNRFFSTGNKQTLGEIPVAVLRKWYEKHYSADKMHLVIYSPLSIQELEKLVSTDFSSVPKREIEPLSIEGPVASDYQKGSIFFIKPVKDLRTISFTWEIPSELANDEHKTGKFFAYLLKSKAENSLFQQLHQEQLAEDLDVDVEQIGKTSEFFRIEIALTSNGVGQLQTVIDRVFQAINHLKSAEKPLPLYEELKTMAKVRYQYQSRQDAFHYVLKQAHQMVDEDLSSYPEKTVMPSSYSPKLAGKFLKLLTPQECIISVLASPQLTTIEPNKKEKWLGGQYARQQLSKERLYRLENIPAHEKIQIPKKNPLISDQLHIETHQAADFPEFSPEVLKDDAHGKMYFLQDAYYKAPQAALFFDMKTPAFDGSAKTTALMDLFLLSIHDHLSSTAYHAENAGLTYRLSLENLSLALKIFGYSDKIDLFAAEIFQALKETKPAQRQFELYKQQLVSNYENRQQSLPFMQAGELLSSILFNDSQRSPALLAALNQIDYATFAHFTEKAFKQSYIEATVTGNYTSQRAQKLWLSLQSTLNAAIYPTDNQKKKEVLVLPQQGGPFKIVEKTSRQGNAINLLIQEGSFTFAKFASSQVLGVALQQPFFNTLRTKQQTAYIAKSGPKLIENQLMQFFSVHSSTHQGDELLARFELFLEDYAKDMGSHISKEKFEAIRDNLIEKLARPSTNLEEYAQKLHQLAYVYQGEFDFYDKSITALKNLSYEQFCQDAQSFLSRDNRHRIAVIIEGKLSPEKDFKYQTTRPDQLKEVGSYISNR